MQHQISQSPKHRVIPQLNFVALSVWLTGLMWFQAVPLAIAQSEDAPEMHKYTNELIRSRSPYLLQHAHNPVNWLPWGPQAFEKAKAENKPIFVSIGYSTCYWCHVMERESFEDEGVAQILNENYIAIKVDREQRPDIDEQLMLATQLLTGRGGWPNSVWLTVDGRPWMAGTYFPRDAFVGALKQLSDVWKTQPENVHKQADSLTDAIRSASQLPRRKHLDLGGQSPLQLAIAELVQLYDEQHGGFGDRPKFPPHGGLRLLSHSVNLGDQQSKRMLIDTLVAMWCGGIHDHVGGGFHRYSTDERWLLPHFEKMLYDNAQLLRAFAEAYDVTGNELCRLAAEDIFAWLQRDMTHPGGAFYSAIDSESEDGEEGRFYTWSIKELRDALGGDDATWIAEVYNAEPAGNFTEEATGERPGTNILFLKPEQIATAETKRAIQIRHRLLATRDQRESPHLDDKVLTSWNGLMISSLARAGEVFQEPKYVEASERAARFILAELCGERALYRSWRNDHAGIHGYLNDYAFFIEGLLALYQATRDDDWLDHARELTGEMLSLFEDKGSGGFFFTSGNHEQLLVRSKNLFGGGNLPVGNGVAAQILLQLHELTGERSYLESCKRTLAAFDDLMRTSPRQVEHLVLAKAQFESRDREQSNQDDRHSEEIELARADNRILSLRVVADQRRFEPGSHAQILVKMDLAEGYHIYRPEDERSLSDRDLPVQTLEMTVASEDGLELVRAVFPPGKRIRDSVLDRKLSIYQGSIQTQLELSIPDTTTAEQAEVQLTIRYQACDDHRCLAPQTLSLAWKIEVARD